MLSKASALYPKALSIPQVKAIYVEVALLIVVILFAGVLRVWTAQEHLPYMTSWDEPQTAQTALRMLRESDPLPGFYQYGSLMIYASLGVDVLHYFYLSGQEDGIRSISDIEASGWHMSHPSFLLWNRMLTVAMGVGTVLLVYAITRKLANRWAALLAAAWLSVLGYHVSYSGAILQDVPVTFFVWLAVWFALLYLDKGEASYLVASLVVSGLAASCKYNAALSMVIPALALALGPRTHYRWWWWLLIPVLPALSFLMTTPGAIFQFQTFLADAGMEVTHYRVEGHGASTSEPGLDNLRFQLSEFVRWAGLPSLLVALVGLVALARSGGRGWLLLAFPLLYGAFMIQMRTNFHKNYMAFYPLIAVAFGVGVWLAVGLLRRYLRGKVQVAAVTAAIVAGMALVALQGVPAVSASYAAATTPEQREVAIDRLNRLGVQSIGIVDRLQFHPHDLQRLDANYTVAPLPELLASADEYDVIVVPTRYTAYRPERREAASNLNTLLASVVAEERIEMAGGASSVDRFNRNPGVVFAISPQATGLGPQVFALDMLQVSDGRLSANDIYLRRNASIVAPSVELAAGEYLFEFDARGTQAYGEFAKLRAIVMADGVVAEAEVELSAVTATYAVPFELADGATVVLSVQFVNDAADSSTGDDRNVTLTGFRLATAQIAVD